MFRLLSLLLVFGFVVLRVGFVCECGVVHCDAFLVWCFA